MPMFLVSGLPGNGKTLRLLRRVRDLQKQSGRAVYYFDIALNRDHVEVRDWIPLGDPETFGRRKERIEPDRSQVLRWHEIVPSGSIVVIDECWAVFEKRAPGSKTPKHVEELATHRHRGVDIFLSSQHASNQMDHFVRGLIQEHEHIVRLFGSERARVHKWSQGLGDPQDYHSRKESVTELWKYPTDVYSWYRSAEQHTIKRNIPWKPVVTVVGGLAAVVGLGYVAYSTLYGNMEAGADALAVAAPGSSGGSVQSPIARPVAKRFVAEDFEPSLPAAPFTAPFYESAVEVAAAPRIAGCGMIKIGHATKCFCNSQQGTRIDVDKRTCINHVMYGSFDFSRDDDYYPKIEPYVPPLAEPVPYVVDSGAPAPQARGDASHGDSDTKL